MPWRGSGSRYRASLWIGVLAWFSIGARFAPSQGRGAGIGRSPEVTAAAHASGLSAHELPTYDVVTIKLSAPGGRGADFDTNEDSYIARGATLKMLLEDAYGIRSQLISGITGPLAETRFDLEAKVVDPDAMRKLTDEQLPAMLQQVLEDRFRVKAHVEMKELPLYELILARGGPKFKQAAKENMDAPEMEIHRRMLDAKAQGMPALANVLTATLGRSVVDKTGLEGNFDFSLRWSPDAEAGADVMAPPGLFAALEDQLGLKLKPAKGPVRTLVVEEAGMPTSN